MLKRTLKMITHNLGLKLLAVFFAVILWIVVVNIDDPMVPRTYTTSITPIHEEYITAQNKYYEPLDNNNTVTFMVSAKRSVLDELSNSDFTAVADMEKIEYDQKEDTYRVPVTITATRYSNSVEIGARQYYYDVGLEELGICQRVISASTKGTVANGCALGNVEIVGSNVLKISGPDSVVSRVDTAVATINVEGVSTDVTDSVVPVLYDANGEVINTAKLKLSISTVTVAAQVLNTKEVSLEFSAVGDVAEGYTMMDITHSLESVWIKGEASVLNKANKVVIPAEVLDVTGATEDFVTTVDITSYLPEGTSLVQASDAKVEVTVGVEPVVSRHFQIPVRNLEIENLQNGYTAEYQEESFAAEIYGPKSIVDALTVGMIRGRANAARLGAGEHLLEVTIEVEDGSYWTEVKPHVAVRISGTAADAGNVGNTTGGDSQADESQNADGGAPEGNDGADAGTPDGGV